MANSNFTPSGVPAVTRKDLAGLLSRLDQASQLAKCVSSTIGEGMVDGLDRRSAVLGIGSLIEAIYNDVSVAYENMIDGEGRAAEVAHG
jgi:hypothetical protein